MSYPRIFSTPGIGNIFEAIDDERARQERLKAEGKFVYSCADAEMTDLERLAVLMEEVGEVSREVVETIGHPLWRLGNDYNERLRAEIVQVAAVCCAWLAAPRARLEDAR